MALPRYNGQSVDDLLAHWGGNAAKALQDVESAKGRLPEDVYAAWTAYLQQKTTPAPAEPSRSVGANARLGAANLLGALGNYGSGLLHGIGEFAEIASKPLYALSGAANAIENLRNPITGAIRSAFPRPGHMDEDRKTITDVIFNPEGRRLDIEYLNRLRGEKGLAPVPVPSGQPNLPERVAGFVGDVAFDPLGAVGNIAKATKAIPHASEAVSQFLKRSEPGQRFLDLFSTRPHLESPETISPNVTVEQQQAAIRSPLIRESGVPVRERQQTAARRSESVESVPELLQDPNALLDVTQKNAGAYQRYLRDKTIEDATRFNDQLTKIEKEGVSRAQMFDAIERGHIQPKLVEALPPDAQQVRREIINANQARLAREVAAGVPVRGLDDVIEYMTHLTTPEAKKALEKATSFRPGHILDWTLKNRFQLERGFKGMSVPQINHYAATHGIEVDGQLVKIPQLFEEDPVKAFLARGYAGAKSEANARFLDDMARLFGKSPNDPAAKAAGYREIQTDSSQYGNLLKDVVFPPEIAGEITRALEPRQADKAAEGLANAFTRSWKVGTLAFRPAYHFRNVVGNWWNNWLSGVTDPRDYTEAAKILKGEDGTIKVGDRTFSFDQFRRALAERGATHQGFYGAEIEKRLATPAESTVRKLLGPAAKATGAFADKSFEIQRKYEDWTRVAHVIDRLKKGDTLDEAVQSMRRTLFDYNDLTDFERNTVRTYVPFYTWTRKNLPFQLENLVENPQKVTAAAKAQTETERGRSTVPPQIRPDFVAGAGNAVEFAPGKFTRLQGTIPSQDIADLSNPAEFVASRLHPGIQAAYALATGSNIFGNDVRSERVKGGQFLPLTDTERALLGLVPGFNAFQDVEKSFAQPGVARKLMSLFTGQRVYDIDPRREMAFRVNDLEDQARSEVYARNRLPKGSAARARQEQILRDTIAKIRGLQQIGKTLGAPGSRPGR